MSNRTTVTLDDDHVEQLNDIQEEHDLDSRSAAMRHCIQQYEELHTEIDELEQELERARRERRQIIDERQEKKELARYVERERERERERENADVVTRAKWWFFGRGEG